MAIILLHPLYLRSVVNKGDLDVRGIPDFGLGAGSADLLVADLQEEVTFFEDPLAIGSYAIRGTVPVIKCFANYLWTHNIFASY